MLDQRLSRLLVPGLQSGQRGLLVLPGQRGRQGVAAANVKNRGRLNTQNPQQLILKENDLRFT